MKKELMNIPAIILVAGKGTRLMPYTKDTPKPLLKVGGHPIMEYVLLNLIKIGIRHFIFITGYKEDLIKNWIQDDFGIKIYCKHQYNFGYDIGPLAFSFIHQEQINGTGGAALLAEEHIKENGYSDFLLTYGDIIASGAVYRRLIKKFRSEAAEAYIVGNPTEDPSSGAAIYYDNSTVTNFIEKPGLEAPKTDLNNSGIYIFHSEIFDRLQHTKPSVRGEIELTQPIIDMVKNQEKVKLVKMMEHEFWCDVGTINVFEDMNKNLVWKDKIF